MIFNGVNIIVSMNKFIFCLFNFVTVYELIFNEFMHAYHPLTHVPFHGNSLSLLSLYSLSLSFSLSLSLLTRSGNWLLNSPLLI